MLSYSSVQFICSAMHDSLRPHRLQHARPPCPPLTPGACTNSCPSSQWCHSTISFSVIPFSSPFNLSQHHNSHIIFSWVPSLCPATFRTLYINYSVSSAPSVWGMTEPTAVSVVLKTVHLLGRAGSELRPHLEHRPSSLPHPSTLPHVSGQEAALTYCLSPLNCLHPFCLSWPPSHPPAITQRDGM